MRFKFLFPRVDCSFDAQEGGKGDTAPIAVVHSLE
jgi:hypothetical protein